MKFTQKDLLANKCTADQYYSQFVDDEVCNIVRRSTTHKYILRSKDAEDFRDITIKQWDTCTANILCYLKGKYRKQEMFTQAKLFTIAKLAAKQILIQQDISQK
jgi:hypothetical protein